MQRWGGVRIQVGSLGKPTDEDKGEQDDSSEHHLLFVNIRPPKGRMRRVGSRVTERQKSLRPDVESKLGNWYSGGTSRVDS